MDKQRESFRDILLIWVDVVSLLMSYILSEVIIDIIKGREKVAESIMSNLWLVFVSYFIVFLFFNMNKYFMKRNKYEETVYILKVNMFEGVVMATVFYMARLGGVFSRGVWLLTILLNLLFMMAFHFIIKRILRKIYIQKKNINLLIITTSDRVQKVAQNMKKTYTLGAYNIFMAVIDKDMKGQHADIFEIVADADNLMEFARLQVIDEVALDIMFSERDTIKEYVDEFVSMGVTAHVNLRSLEKLNNYNRKLGRLGEYSVVSYAPNFYDYNKLVLKRLIDIVGAIVGLIITGIATIFVAPAIMIESPGPIFFKQKRVGKNGRIFYIYKFRSMYKDAEARKAALMAQNEMKGAMFKMTNDPRVTKVGKFIRDTSIDELPQFWNVLKGDMSLVGTRPPTVDEFKEYRIEDKRRLSLKPGLTGLWQVSGRSNIEDFDEVVRLDCEYIDNWSIQYDLIILLKTIVVVFKKVGSK